MLSDWTRLFEKGMAGTQGSHSLCVVHLGRKQRPEIERLIIALDTNTMSPGMERLTRLLITIKSTIKKRATPHAFKAVPR